MNVNLAKVRASLIKELEEAQEALEDAIQGHKKEYGEEILVMEPFYIEPALMIYLDGDYLCGYSRPDPSEESEEKEYNEEEIGVDTWTSLLYLIAQDIESGEIFENDNRTGTDSSIV